jgi:SAM-dependent methyltransferase
MSEPLTRTPLQGVVNIVRFNAPVYVLASVVVVAGVVAGVAAPAGSLVAWLGAAASSAAALLTTGSLVASYLTYDRSGFYTWAWFDRFVSSSTTTIAHVHTGLDESTAILRARHPHARVVVFDASAPHAQTEPSIARARAVVPLHEDTIAVSLGPLPENGIDVIVLPMAAHEVRDDDIRARWFATLARALRDGGRIVVVEHLRDARNALAFHVGVLHFLSRERWRVTFARAGLVIVEESQVTPLLAVFVLACDARAPGDAR